MKMQRLIIVTLLLVVLGGCLTVILVHNQDDRFKDLPPVAFNFLLSKEDIRYSDSSHIYEYDLATKKVCPTS